ERKYEILRRIAKRHSGQKLLRLFVGVFFDALHPDGKKHVAENSACELHVRAIVTVDVGEIEKDLPAQVIDAVSDDAELAGRLALKEIREILFLILVSIRDSCFRARAEAGACGDF